MNTSNNAMTERIRRVRSSIRCAIKVLCIAVGPLQVNVAHIIADLPAGRSY
jgi:hypothetical protein